MAKDMIKRNGQPRYFRQNGFRVIQPGKRLAVLKLRLRFPFRSPANAGSLHSQRSLRAPRGSASSKLNGFSMIELLVAAFVLAIGILGLAMLQAMSLRASRGSGNLGTAVRVAEKVMNQVELEGRLSWLNITDENLISPSITNLDFDFKYVTMGTGADIQLVEKFNPKGELVIAGTPGSPAADPIDAVEFYTVTTRKLEQGANSAGAVGSMSEFQVQVEFTETMDSRNQPVIRTFNLTRRIIHG